MALSRSLPQLSRTKGAIVAIMISVAALSLGDALIKGMGLALPLWQMFVLRSALTLVPLWWLARRGGPICFDAPIWVVLRSALLVLMWLCYYAALPQMPLSLAAAAYYTGPLFIVAFSAIAGGRRPSARILAAIFAGFLGVLLIIRPDTSAFSAATLLPILAAVLYAVSMVITSVKCQGESPFALAFALHLAFLGAGGALGLASGQKMGITLGAWQPVDGALMLSVAALALLILIGSVGAAIAYQNGPPATIAVFDYSYLGFSLAWGGLFFAEIPGAIAVIGIGLIAAAGMLSLSPRLKHPGD